MIITRLSRRRDVLGTLPPEHAAALCAPTHCHAEVAAVLDALHRAREWIVCGCGWTFHARAGVTLARNPGQEGGGDVEPCALCVAWPYQPGARTPGEDGEQRPAERGLLLIATGRRRGGEALGRLTGDGSRGPRPIKYASMFRALWTLMEDAGLLSLMEPMPDTEIWSRIREACALAPLGDAASGLTFGDLLWTPDSGETPEEILTRLEEVWQERGVRPQVWLMAILPTVPRAQGDRLHLTITGQHHALEVNLGARNRSVIGVRGPHLVLIQATRDRDDGVRYDKLAAQAILGAECPLPVDSDHERGALQIIHELGMRVYKPVFPVVDDLTPDAMLLDLQVLVEVQGMRKEGYADRKVRVHERMRTHPALRGWILITYDPHRESRADLRWKLRRWWREGQGLAAAAF